MSPAVSASTSDDVPAGPTDAAQADSPALRIGRHFTADGVHPYETVDWERRDALITSYADGSVAFSQPDVEFPCHWSATASNIVAQKYFRGTLGTPERERSLAQVVDRVAGTIAAWALEDGYFDDAAEADAFCDELRWLLVHQRAAFNSPVWFNIGVEGVPQQASACFILAVSDDMESILNWYTEEGRIFKGGSGAGVNLSPIRASCELLAGGGEASGPVSFMRGADASAGTIRSGGKTRRAAKMVLLDADHPDIEAFVWCKAREERKARALAQAGFDMSLDGDDAHSVQYQNANNSVRVTDEFMDAVAADAAWPLRARTTGETVTTLSARDLFGQIARAAWECADPGVQFTTTINGWHTAPNTGPINASNPCSEYLHLDNSACNLASINLLSFWDSPSPAAAADPDADSTAVGGAPSGSFDVDGFVQAVRVLFVAQDVLVGRASYPTSAIAATSRRFRQLGLGFTNLGALLMAVGVPYDSDAGRALAGSLTALLCGSAYACSADMAARLGPFDGFAENAQPMADVLRRHRDAVDRIEPAALRSGAVRSAVEALSETARRHWDHAVAGCGTVGVRNAQATVIAPTGTISFMMDCDTTGIEPDLGLVKHKKLVGGGDLQIVNATLPRALRALGYDDDEIADITAHVLATSAVTDAPHLVPEHEAVFACSIGEGAIAPSGHLEMMAACQPFVSGAISKTVNLPEQTAPDDIERIFERAWRLGLKAVAVYRDNCKVGQPLSVGDARDGADGAEGIGGGASADGMLASGADRLLSHAGPVRERLPRARTSRTFSFRVTDCHGFMTVGEYPDGRPGEIFLTVAKQGSTLAGIMDAFAISVSHGLQHGVPLSAYVEAFTNVRFEPAGLTDDPDLRIATSIVDYIFRRLALDYLPLDERTSLGVLSISERTDPPLPGLEAARVENPIGAAPAPDPSPLQTAVDRASAHAESTTARPRTAQPRLADPRGSASGSASTGAVSSSIAQSAMFRDAPLCMTCGDAMTRAGTCFVCRSCGATSGCA